MHLLCYIAHLRTWTHALIRHEALTSLCLSLIPEGYITAAKHEFDVAIAERFMKWFRSTFQLTERKCISRNGSCDSQVMLFICTLNDIRLIDEILLLSYPIDEVYLMFSSVFYTMFFVELNYKFR